MVIRSGVRALFAGCMSAALFVALPALAEDNGFGVSNSGGSAAPIATPAAAPVPAAPSAPAHGAMAPVVGVVDMDFVMSQSAAAKSVAAQREKWQQTYQAELSKEDTALRDTKQKLEQDHGTMAPEAFQTKAREFEQNVGEFQRKLLQRSRALDKAYATAMAQVERAMLETTAQVAGSHNINLVLPRSQVLLFADAMNISKEISDNLNKKLSKVDMPTPQIEALDAPAAAKKQ